MFDFCLVIELPKQIITKWLSARSMYEANEKVDQTLTAIAIAQKNVPVQDIKIIFDRSNFSRTARR